MKLPNFKRLYYPDFQKEYQQLIEQLSYTVNTSLEGLFSALNNGISIRDNIQATVKDISVTTNASGTPIATTAFSVGNSNPIDGTLVIRAINPKDNASVPTSGIFISYSQNANVVTITNITGLPANIAFTVRIIAFLT